jgi:hypothetical protein
MIKCKPLLLVLVLTTGGLFGAKVKTVEPLVIRFATQAGKRYKINPAESEG